MARNTKCRFEKSGFNFFASVEPSLSKRYTSRLSLQSRETERSVRKRLFTRETRNVIVSFTFRSLVCFTRKPREFCNNQACVAAKVDFQGRTRDRTKHELIAVITMQIPKKIFPSLALKLGRTVGIQTFEAIKF